MFADEDSNLFNFLAVAVQPASILMPIVGILLVSSEWTQRTAMVTFTLVPHRSRVLVAKLLAGLALAAIAFQICLVAALVATAFFGADGDATWSLSAGLIVQVAVSVVVPMLIGIGFGAVLLASAPAIVLYFVLPTAFAALGAISALSGAARWLDQTRTMEPLLEETLSATQWARVGDVAGALAGGADRARVLARAAQRRALIILDPPDANPSGQPLTVSDRAGRG